jgi:TolB protein
MMLKYSIGSFGVCHSEKNKRGIRMFRQKSSEWLKRSYAHSHALCLGFVLAMVLVIGHPNISSAQLHLTIRKIHLKNYAVAIPDFLVQDGINNKMGGSIAQILRNDLQLSGVFRVLAPNSYLESAPRNGIEPGQFDFAPWRSIGAQGIIKGSVEPSAGGMRIKYRFYEVGSGNLAINEEFILDAKQRNNLRWYVHLISEKVYRYLTKEQGIFTTKIVCVRMTGERQELWFMDFDGSNPKQLTNNGSINALPSWSPDGRNIAYTSWRDQNPDLYILDRTTGKSRKISGQRGLNTGASWSPDGRRLAFSASLGRANMDIYKINADGSGLQRLTNAKSWERNLSPSWSPDGRQITFVSNRYSHPHIFVMNADGSNQRQLTTQGRYNQAPKWSQRGDWILFTGRDERNVFDLFKISPSSGKIQRLTQNQGNNTEADWSPNGRNIVFTSTRNGVPKLFVMTADGKNARQITFMPGTFQTPSWSPPFFK